MELLGTKLGAIAAIALGAGALLLGAAGLGYLAAAKLETTLQAVAQEVREERDAHWQLEIQKANAAVASAQAEQAKAVLDIQADAADRVNAASQQLEEVRKRNAALPHGDDIGLTADRVSLLPD